jgi:predicted TPR repeat methyltransferase
MRLTTVDEPKPHSGYAEWHKSAWVPTYYDDVVYAADTHDTFVWQLERPLLVRLVSALAAPRGRLKGLDFACGTGRVTATLEQLPVDCTGVDTSPSMLAAAGQKLTRTRLVQGDLLEQPSLVDDDYDLITAFRFFLNTEPEMRRRIMGALAGRLRRPDGRLIFNMHANALSSLALESAVRAARGQGRLNTMTLGDVRALVAEAGLEIEAWYGCAVLPARLYRTPLAPLCRRFDRWAAGRRGLGPVSQDLLFICRPPAAAGSRPAL